MYGNIGFKLLSESRRQGVIKLHNKYKPSLRQKLLNEV